MPPSTTLWPAALWPPLRTASWRPVSRARANGLRDITVGDLDDDRRPGIDAAEGDGPSRVVVGVIGRDDPSAKVGSELGDGKLIGHRRIVASPGQARESLGARSVDQASGS